MALSKSFAILTFTIITCSNANSVDALCDDVFCGFTEAISDAGASVKKIENDNADPAADLLRYNVGLTNEDKYLNATQLLVKYGYPAEEHEVQTGDGYLLTVVRVRRAGPPVLLMHGLLGSADDFLTSGPDGALAYALADAGYDVWLGNARGNTYSRKHVSISPTEKTFWDFSWHEIGILDLPAMMDFILAKTDRSNLYYIGYSQGTTASYVLLSEKPEYNHKIRLLVSLAPAVWMSHLTSPLVRAAAPFIDAEYFGARALGVDELLPDNVLTAAARDALCGSSVTAVAVCNSFISLLSGFDFAQVNFTNLPVQLGHVPAGSAIKQAVHYGQEINSGRFEQFDYGVAGNLLRYGSQRPPRYAVSRVTVAAALVYSDNDQLVNPVDVARLAHELPNVRLHYIVPLPYSHLDFIWGKSAKELVYSKILDLFSSC